MSTGAERRILGPRGYDSVSVFVHCRLLLCCLLLSFWPGSQCVAAAGEPLTVSVFISGITEEASGFTGELDGRPFQAATELARELINNNPDVLPGYELQLDYTDAKCDAGSSVRGFIDQIFENSTRYMIIGADCSISTEPIAELAPFWNLVQVGALSSSPSLSRDETFSTFLRVVSSDVAAAEGVVSLMRQFDWTRVAVVTQQETIFTSTFSRLQELLDMDGSEPREFSFNTNDNPLSHVNRLANSPTRIIFLNVYPEYAIEILCQAYNLELTLSNGYLWLTFAWYPDEWWTEPANRTNYNPVTCPQDVLESMIEHSIIIDHYAYVQDKNSSTNVGITRYEFEQQLLEKINTTFSTPVDTSLASQAQFYFDALWAGVLGLTETLEMFNLSDFSYDPALELAENFTEFLHDSIQAVKFTGVSGEVEFNSNGDRSPQLRFFQYRRSVVSGALVREFIGTNTEESPLVDDDIFPFGVPQDEQFVYISRALFIVYTILSCIGIGFAVVCLTMNLIFKERKVVKLSSPYLNVLIVVGVILFYVDVILFGVDEGTPASRCTVNALCMTRLWIASIAFSLLFGTIFVKTWRVYYIFYSDNRHKKGKKTVIQDWVLYVMVGVLVTVDVVYMIIVTAIPTSRLQLEDVEMPSSSRALPQIVGLCRAADSQAHLIWLGILLAYKGILLIVGLFLAFETRKVKIRQLNDSKLIGMSVYGIVVLSVALAAIGIFLEAMVNVFYIVTGLMMLVGNTCLLCLIFIPKLYGLWKDPEGLRIITGTAGTAFKSTGEENKETINQLSQEVQRLKQELRRVSISTTTSAGEVQGISGSPLKNGSEHLSPASGGSELFPVQEERESFHGEGSVFNVTFSGQFDSKPGMGLEPQAGVKSENGNGPLQATITNSDGTVLFNSQQPA